MSTLGELEEQRARIRELLEQDRADLVEGMVLEPCNYVPIAETVLDYRAVLLPNLSQIELYDLLTSCSSLVEPYYESFITKLCESAPENVLVCYLATGYYDPRLAVRLLWTLRVAQVVPYPLLPVLLLSLDLWYRRYDSLSPDMIRTLTEGDAYLFKELLDWAGPFLSQGEYDTLREMALRRESLLIDLGVLRDYTHGSPASLMLLLQSHRY